MRGGESQEPLNARRPFPEQEDIEDGDHDHGEAQDKVDRHREEMGERHELATSRQHVEQDAEADQLAPAARRQPPRECAA